MFTNLSSARLVLIFRLIVLVMAVASIGLMPVLAQDPGSETPQPILNPTEMPTDSTPIATITVMPTATEPPPAQAPTATTPVKVSVSGIEPSIVTSGQEIPLSIFGLNFTDMTMVRLVGAGLLQTTYISSTALQATFATHIQPGVYRIEVSDPVNGVAYAPNNLTVMPPPSTSMPIPTLEPLPSPEPPTPIPGQPSLVVENFTANPTLVQPGETVSLTFDVVNQGSRNAQGVAVALSESSEFAPADGQSSALVGNIGTGGRASVSLNVITPAEAAPGPASIALTLTYRDFSGEIYTSSARLSITIAEEPAETSQIVLIRYSVEPNPVVPGEAVMIRALFKNTGNAVASQVLLRVNGSDNVLLAGPEGDSFSLGDLHPGHIVARDLQLVVSPAAEAGPQAQAFELNFLQEDEAQQSGGSLTVAVLKPVSREPLLLLDSYDIGEESILQPGQQFTLTLNLKNVGDADAEDLLVTFGTVDPSNGGSGDGSGGGGSATPSTVFAPLRSGGTIYAGTIEKEGGTYTLAQDFIVNGTVESGIYGLPITLLRMDEDGDTIQTALSASIVVVKPPLLQVSQPGGPLPPMANTGEPLMVSLELANLGEKSINLTGATITTDNGEVVDGADITLGPLTKEDEASINGVVIPQIEGPVAITVTIHYRDDLNNEQSIVKTFETQAMLPPPPPDDPGMPLPEPTEEPDEDDEDDDDIVGRFLRGILGLGS